MLLLILRATYVESNNGSHSQQGCSCPEDRYWVLQGPWHTARHLIGWIDGQLNKCKE